MAKVIVAEGRLAVVGRDLDEEGERYWDRSWAFVAAARAAGARAAWLESLKRPHERRGGSYPPPPRGP